MLDEVASAMATFSFFYSTATVVFIYAVFREHFPQQLQDDIEKYGRKLVNFAYPYTQITFDEFCGDHYMRCNEAFTAIQNYLHEKSTDSAKRLKADAVKDSQTPVLSMDYNEEVMEEFRGVKVWWSLSKTSSRGMQLSIFPGADERRYYKLTFHDRHKNFIIRTYLNHVLRRGKEIGIGNRQRKLYSNNPSKHWHGYNESKWSHVIFEHPATFETLAMDEKMKEEIKNDLHEFVNGRDCYKRIGKAWKRGYLLYGPPGTGKSTMVAAMANFLQYDVYDVELTTVKDNTELRRLLMDTSNKSIIVIEDIDCSLVLTTQRDNNNNKKKRKKSEKENDYEWVDPEIGRELKENESTESKLTLSGVFNFIDGLWPSCGEERIIIFTTNHIEKLDPALIRRGRMDVHIEMSYCCFNAFKVLANKYLEIDSHFLFEEIGTLLGTTKMTPADVAENLLPKSKYENAETLLNRLIEALKDAKEKEGNKVEEEATRSNDQKRKRNNKPIKTRKRRTI